MSKPCPICGTDNAQAARSCRACGASFEAAATTLPNESPAGRADPFAGLQSAPVGLPPRAPGAVSPEPTTSGAPAEGTAAGDLSGAESLPPPVSSRGRLTSDSTFPSVSSPPVAPPNRTRLAVGAALAVLLIAGAATWLVLRPSSEVVPGPAPALTAELLPPPAKPVEPAVAAARLAPTATPPVPSVSSAAAQRPLLQSTPPPVATPPIAPPPAVIVKPAQLPTPALPASAPMPRGVRPTPPKAEQKLTSKPVQPAPKQALHATQKQSQAAASKAAPAAKRSTPGSRRAEAAAREKAERDAKARAEQSAASLKAEQEAQARRRAEEQARPAPVVAAPPPPAPPRSVRELCAGRGGISEGLCQARACNLAQHAGESICAGLREADDRRRNYQN